MGRRAMTATTAMQRVVILFGLLAIAATGACAQGPPGVPVPTSWNGFNPNNPSNSDGDSDGGDGNSNNDNGDSTGSVGVGAGGSIVGGNGGFGSGGGSSGGGSGSFTPGFGSGSGSYGGFDFDSLERASELASYSSAHGALAAVSFALLFPLGAILIRTAAAGRRTVATHAVLQVFAYAAYIAAAGLGLYLISTIRDATGGAADLLAMSSTNAHPIIGLALLAALLAQPFLGALHHARFRRTRRRGWASHAHLWLGRLGVTLGIINGGLGLALARTPRPYVVAYAVVAAVMWLLWLLTAILGERRRGRERRDNPDEPKHVYRKEVDVPGSGGGGTATTTTIASREYVSDVAVVGARTGGASGLDEHGPSPPYTPGPHYEAHMARMQNRRVGGGGGQAGMGASAAAKEDTLDVPPSDSVSILSALQDEMHRGQV